MSNKYGRPKTSINVNRSLSKAVKRIEGLNLKSSSVASPVDVQTVYQSIEQYMLEMSREEEGGYLYELHSFRDRLEGVLVPAWDLAHTAGAFAALVLPAVDPRVKPDWMLQSHYEEFVMPPAVHTAIDVVVGAAPAATIPYPEPPREVEIEVDQDDFDELLLQVLIAGGHSGYASLSTLKQKFRFYVYGRPTRPYGHVFRLSSIGTFLPEDVTFYNFAAAHADQVLRTAKESGVVFEWGERHGLDSALGWAGVPIWFHASQTILSQDDREVLAVVKDVAIRDSRSVVARDPSAPPLEERESVEAAANRLAFRRTLIEETPREERDPKLRGYSRYSQAGIESRFEQWAKDHKRSGGGAGS